MSAIGRFFGAIRRVGRAFIYRLTGRIDERTKGINEDPHVVRAEYDEIVAEKTENVRAARDAVAGLMRHYEDKVAKLEDLGKRIDKHTRLMNGAKAMASKIVKEKGLDKEASQKDPEFIKCMKAFQDFKSTLDELNRQHAELQADVAEDDKRIKGYEIQLQGLYRDLQKLKEEREEMVAGVVMATKDRELNETLAQIGKDNTAERLEGLRGRVRQAQAEAKVTAKLAGTETAVQEAEFLEMAGAMEADSEFMDGIFGKDKDAPAEAAPVKETEGGLPE